MNVLEMDLTEPEIIEKVSRSLALGEDINELDDQGKTILDYALLSPHRFLVHYLLRGGARVGFQSFFSTFTKNRFFNGPAFGQFLAEGNHDVARIFLNMIDCNSSKKNFYIFYAKKCIRYKQFNGLLTSISVEPNISLKQEILKEVFFLAIETRKLQLILALLDR